MLTKNHFYFNWLIKKPTYRHVFNLGSGLFVWLFLLITLPFGIYNNNLNNFGEVALFLLPVGVVWIISFYLVDLIPSKYNQKGLLFILKLVLFVHIVYLIRQYLCDNCVDISEYLQLWLASFLLYFFFYFPFSLYARYQYFHSLVGVQPDDQSLWLKGEGKEKLLVKLSQLTHIRSDDNYVNLYILDDGKPLKRILFRATLKSINDQLGEEKGFIQVHRSFLINLKFVDAETFTKTSLGLRISGELESIPISAKYADHVMHLVKHPK